MPDDKPPTLATPEAYTLTQSDQATEEDRDAVDRLIDDVLANEGLTANEQVELIAAWRAAAVAVERERCAEIVKEELNQRAEEGGEIWIARRILDRILKPPMSALPRSFLS